MNWNVWNKSYFELRIKIWNWTWSSQSNEQPEQLQKEPGKSLNFIRFFFNRLGCSFYCEDHVQFHIFIRSSNHFIYFNTRIFLYQLLFSLVISSFVFKNLLLFVFSATSESVDGMVKALWTFRRTQASLSIKEGKSALQVKCSLNGHVTFSLASHPNRDPPL